VIKKNFNGMRVSELRYVRFAGQQIPKPQITADHLFISPHFDGNKINHDNLNHCLQLCRDNPQWRLSVQIHKLLNLR